MPCVIRMLKVPKPVPYFHAFEEFERLVGTARAYDWRAELAVLLGGEAGLRLGEVTALERDDCLFETRQLRIARSEWKGKTSTPKSGQTRYVPMTQRLAALQQHRHLRHKRVLCTDTGQPLTTKQVSDFVRRAANRAGLER